MRVRALEEGYDNIKVREPGEEFEMPDGAIAPWFERVDGPASTPVGKTLKLPPRTVQPLQGNTDLV